MPPPQALYRAGGATASLPGSPKPGLRLMCYRSRTRFSTWHTGSMHRWELWQGEGEYSFFPATNEKNRVMARVLGHVKTWEIDASSFNGAMQALNEHLGFGPYQPAFRDDGTPFPEDEDDDLRGEDDMAYATWPGSCSVTGTIINVPGRPDPDEVVRRGALEFVCPACGQSHTWRFVT